MLLIMRKEFNAHFHKDINIPSRLFYSFMPGLKTDSKKSSLYVEEQKLRGKLFWVVRNAHEEDRIINFEGEGVLNR